MKIINNLSRKKRGISTIVTTVILLVSISIMGVMLVGWSNTSLFTKQAEMEASFGEKMNKLNEDLLIENTWFSSGATPGENFVNVTISNTGIIGLNVTEIKIENSTDVLTESIFNGGAALGELFSFQREFYWSAGETTDFTITTNRENQFVTQEVT